MQRLLRQAKPADIEARSSTKEITHFAHDFSRIPVQAQSPAGVQAKLDVSAPGDIYEQEADRVSEQVMAKPAHHAVEGAALGSRGQQMDGATRRAMEGRFGHDFSGVRVRTDALAGETMRSLRARACTVGEEIAFAPGQYRPESREGARLLAHELTHVVQQRRGGPAPVRDRAAPSEREAERAAQAVETGAPFPALTQGTSVGAAFQPDDEGMTPAHAGGAMGELDAAFKLGERGFMIVIGPAGAGGHQLTEAGLDIVAYNPQSDETWVVDNKASGGTSTVQDASAITRNLAQNLRTAIAQIRTLPAFPHQERVIQQLESALDAVTKGNPMPAKVLLKITGAGGFHSGISKKLRAQGIQWEDLTGTTAVRDARKRDIARARIAGVRPGRPVTHPAESDTVVVRVTAPALSDVDEPPTTAGGGSQRPSVSRGGGSQGSNVRAGAVAGAASFGTSVATLLINQQLQEHFAEYRAEGIREFTAEALEKANPKFEETIRRHQTEIEKAQAEGRHVYLHVVTKVRMVDTTDRDPIAGSGLGIGDVAYGSEVEEVHVVYEGGPKPKPYRADTWLIGDLFRGLFGVSSRYETSHLPIGGTNLAVRRRNEVVRDVEGIMTEPGRPFQFETLVVKSQIAGVSKELLREYAAYKRELSAASPFSRDRQAVDYWARMEALAGAPIAEVITQAKVALVPLDELRQFAFEQRLMEDKWGNADAAARWSAVMNLIDAPLDERLHAERQRSVWKRGPSEAEVGAQQDTVAALERRKNELERRLAEMRLTDARTQPERDAGEPPHPPWAKMAEVTAQIKALEEEVEVYVGKRLLHGMKKR